MPAQARSGDPEIRGPAGKPWTTSRRLTDVVLAVTTTAGVAACGVLLGLATDGAVVVADATGSGVLAVVVGALVLLHRRAPAVMLLGTALVVVSGAVLDVPAAATALPVTCALGAAAAAGHGAAAAWTGGAVVAALTVDRAVLGGRLQDALGDDGTLTLLVGGVLDVLMVVAAVALGTVARLRAQVVAVTAGAGPGGTDADPGRSDAGRSTAASARRDRERLRIAHDLHDVVAHNLTVVTLHSGVASAAVGRDDDAARTALRHVRDATAATLHELRATASVLRRDTADAHPDPPGTRGVLPAATGPAGLSSLVEPVRAAGVDVVTRVEVPAASIDASVDAAAYRIVQEALANVLAHAAAERAVVRLTATDGRLRITVSDDGHGAAAEVVAAGAGVAAMRERARALGGTLTVREATTGGLTVVADLPARLVEEQPPAPSDALAP